MKKNSLPDMKTQFIRYEKNSLSDMKTQFIRYENTDIYPTSIIGQEEADDPRAASPTQALCAHNTLD